MNLRQELFNNQDTDYREFHARLIPTTDKDRIIGVRVPVLRNIAKNIDANVTNELYYHEEKMVYGFYIGYKKCTLQEHIEDMRSFVPLIDNWAVCDSCCSSFKFTKKHLDELYDFYISYIGKEEYGTRFAVVMLMSYYLVDDYIDRVLDVLLSIDDDRYYVMMAIAWALSVAFVKYEAKVVPILESKTLPKELHNTTIQKIKDSYRVDKETKNYLSTLKK